MDKNTQIDIFGHLRQDGKITYHIRLKDEIPTTMCGAIYTRNAHASRTPGPHGKLILPLRLPISDIITKRTIESILSSVPINTYDLTLVIKSFVSNRVGVYGHDTNICQACILSLAVSITKVIKQEREPLERHERLMALYKNENKSGVPAVNDVDTNRIERKHLKLTSVSIPQMKCWLLQVVEQTHRGRSFSVDNNKFFASNGCAIESLRHPGKQPHDNYILYVRGRQSYNDNMIIVVTDVEVLKRFTKAVKEYNEYFSGKQKTYCVSVKCKMEVIE